MYKVNEECVQNGVLLGIPTHLVAKFAGSDWKSRSYTKDELRNVKGRLGALGFYFTDNCFVQIEKSVPTTPKYRIGDKVKIKSLEHSSKNLDGYMDYLVGTVQEVIGASDKEIVVKNRDESSFLHSKWYIDVRDVEPDDKVPARKKKILYPVGTKVVITDGPGAGVYGRVVEYFKGSTIPYRVKSFSGKIYAKKVNELKREPVYAPDDKMVNFMPAHKHTYTEELRIYYRLPKFITKHNFEDAEKAPQEKEKLMDKESMTLRQKVRYAALSKDEKVLRESGFHDSSGALTEQGRRIVVDVLWDTLSAADRKKVVEAVKATLPKEK